MSRVVSRALYVLWLTFEVLDDELLSGAGFGVRQARRDPVVDAVRVADCQRRKVGPLLRVGRRVRHDDDPVDPDPDVVRLRDARGRGQLVALGSARVIQHHREVGGSSGGGGGDDSGSSGGGDGRSLHLSCGQNLGIIGPRHMRALSGRRPELSVQRDSSSGAPDFARRSLSRACNWPLVRLRQEAYLSTALDAHDGDNRRQPRTYMRDHPTPTLVYFSLFLSPFPPIILPSPCDTMKMRNN